MQSVRHNEDLSGLHLQRPKPMQPTLPLEPGAVYHLYNRGNNRDDIFRDDGNYEHFLKLYAQHILPIVETYCYCLMKCS